MGNYLSIFIFHCAAAALLKVPGEGESLKEIERTFFGFRSAVEYSVSVRRVKKNCFDYSPPTPQTLSRLPLELRATLLFITRSPNFSPTRLLFRSSSMIAAERKKLFSLCKNIASIGISGGFSCVVWLGSIFL